MDWVTSGLLYSEASEGKTGEYKTTSGDEWLKSVGDSDSEQFQTIERREREWMRLVGSMSHTMPVPRMSGVNDIQYSFSAMHLWQCPTISSGAPQ